MLSDKANTQVIKCKEVITMAVEKILMFHMAVTDMAKGRMERS